MDWPEKLIYLKQRDDRKLKHNIRTFGLTYDYFDGAIRVASIYEGSEAEKIGLKIGDSIFEINGQKVDNLSEKQIQNFLHGKINFSHDTDKSLSLVVFRNGTQKKVELYSYFLFKEKFN